MDSLCLQMPPNARLVERLNSQAKMIQVAAFLPGRCTTGFAELAINGHEIDDRPPSAKLDQANFVLTSLDRAA